MAELKNDKNRTKNRIENTIIFSLSSIVLLIAQSLKFHHISFHFGLHYASELYRSIFFISEPHMKGWPPQLPLPLLLFSETQHIKQLLFFLFLDIGRSKFLICLTQVYVYYVFRVRFNRHLCLLSDDPQPTIRDIISVTVPFWKVFAFLRIP